MTTLDLYGLGVHSRVTVEGPRTDELLDALREVWSRCLAPRGGEVPGEDLALTLEGDPAPLLQRFTQDVTQAAIKAQRGRLFMFHAGAVTSPATGATLAYVAPGGTGKTTLSAVLGRTHGYVTDETVGFTPDGRVLPYEKPLSVRPKDFTGVKVETSPTSSAWRTSTRTPTCAGSSSSAATPRSPRRRSRNSGCSTPSSSSPRRARPSARCPRRCRRWPRSWRPGPPRSW